jgi:hypothetical protein
VADHLRVVSHVGFLLTFDVAADVPVHRLEMWERIRLNSATGS